MICFHDWTVWSLPEETRGSKIGEWHVVQISECVKCRRQRWKSIFHGRLPSREVDPTTGAAMLEKAR